MGKQDLDSKVTERGIGKRMPLNAETRQPDLEKAGHFHLSQQSCNNLKDGAHSSSLPFRISIDGEPLNPVEGLNSADIQRCKDINLRKADIQVRFDRMEDTQALNITAFPSVANQGEQISFTPYSNYVHFIDRAEVRVFIAGQSLKTTPIKVLPVNASFNDKAIFPKSRSLATGEYVYVLRVYDEKGRFDETSATILKSC